MARLKCPHCGREVTTKWSTFSMLMPVTYHLGMQKMAQKDGVSVSSLVNKAVTSLTESSRLPICPVSNHSVGYNLTEETLSKAKVIAKKNKIGMRAVIRGAVSLAYFNKQ